MTRVAWVLVGVGLTLVAELVALWAAVSINPDDPREAPREVERATL